MQNQSNRIAQLRVSSDGSSATVVRTLTDSDFSVPTTIAFGPKGDPYAVDAKFGTVPSDSVDYNIVRVPR